MQTTMIMTTTRWCVQELIDSTIEQRSGVAHQLHTIFNFFEVRIEMRGVVRADHSMN
jgi:hypothetical protein